MLANFVTDLPVVDDAGRQIGIFTLERWFGALLTKGALIGFGFDDLSFTSNRIEHLQQQMRGVVATPARQMMVQAEHIVHRGTPPIEIVLRLYRGTYNVPVVERDVNKRIGMVSSRDMLNALQLGQEQQRRRVGATRSVADGYEEMTYTARARTPRRSSQ